jgi:hypothetical protein
LWDSTQARARLDPTVIDEYVEAMTEGAIFPPVVLFWDDDLYWIGDGYHRIKAAQRVGFTTIKAEVRGGGEREALLYACSANASHGLRRTNADKRKAVEALLADDEWRQWSNNHIAKHCGVSLDLVNRLRHALNDSLSSDGQRTYERNGQERIMETSRIGWHTREPAAESVNDHSRAVTPASGNGAAVWLPRIRAADRTDPLALAHANLHLAIFGFESYGGIAAAFAAWSPEEQQAFLERVEEIDELWQRVINEVRPIRETGLLTEAKDPNRVTTLFTSVGNEADRVGPT